jgi:tetratricopeptide (TPR) repeat protein
MSRRTLGNTAFGIFTALALSTFAGGARAQLAAPPEAKEGHKLDKFGELPAIDGQLSRKFRIDEDSPEASVPSLEEANKNPLETGYLLQDLIVRGEAAKAQKDFAAMIRYYRAVARAVPERSKGWGKLCEAYQLSNDRDKALGACRYAVERDGSELQDFVRFVELTLQQPGPLAEAQRQEMGKVLAHLQTAGADGLVLEHLRCEVAVKTADLPLLETCTRGLARLAPDDPKTIVFQWNLAMQRRRGTEAERLLERAKDFGVPKDNVALMVEVTERLTGRGSRQRLLWSAAAAALALAALIVGAAWVRRRRILASP